jgi:hypothetical protein
MAKWLMPSVRPLFLVILMLVMMPLASVHADSFIAHGLKELIKAEALSHANCSRFAAVRAQNWRLPGCVIVVRGQIASAMLRLEPALVGQPFVRRALQRYLGRMDRYLDGLPRVGREPIETWQERYRQNVVGLAEAHDDLAAEVQRFLDLSL